MIFTDDEYAYLAGHPLGRLATIGPDGAPQIHPVAFWLNDGTATIDIGGPALARSQKFRNIQADPRVSFVVDDQAETPNPIGQTGRGIEVRGHAEIVTLDPPSSRRSATRRSASTRTGSSPGTSASSRHCRPDGYRTCRATTPATYPDKDHAPGSPGCRTGPEGAQALCPDALKDRQWRELCLVTAGVWRGMPVS
jgi:PPOX class F420-dependent enzyme/OxyR family protein